MYTFIDCCIIGLHKTKCLLNMDISLWDKIISSCWLWLLDVINVQLWLSLIKDDHIFRYTRYAFCCSNTAAVPSIKYCLYSLGWVTMQVRHLSVRKCSDCTLSKLEVIRFVLLIYLWAVAHKTASGQYLQETDIRSLYKINEHHITDPVYVT